MSWFSDLIYVIMQDLFKAIVIELQRNCMLLILLACDAFLTGVWKGHILKFISWPLFCF